MGRAVLLFGPLHSTYLWLAFTLSQTEDFSFRCCHLVSVKYAQSYDIKLNSQGEKKKIKMALWIIKTLGQGHQLLQGFICFCKPTALQRLQLYRSVNILFPPSFIKVNYKCILKCRVTSLLFIDLSLTVPHDLLCINDSVVLCRKRSPLSRLLEITWIGTDVMGDC